MGVRFRAIAGIGARTAGEQDSNGFDAALSGHVMQRRGVQTVVEVGDAGLRGPLQSMQGRVGQSGQGGWRQRTPGHRKGGRHMHAKSLRPVLVESILLSTRDRDDFWFGLFPIPLRVSGDGEKNQRASSVGDRIRRHEALDGAVPVSHAVEPRHIENGQVAGRDE